MQFCIFCGQSLVVSSAPLVGKLVCTLCGKDDPLNGQFCVFCGGRTVVFNSADANQSVHSPEIKPSVITPKRAAGGIPSVAVGSSKGASSTVVVMMLGLLTGGVLGLALTLMAWGKLDLAMVKHMWPKEGLVLYGSQPLSSLSLESADEKNFFFGSTGSSGSLAMENLPPGSYRLQLNGKNNKVIKKDLQINNGQPVVLGYPEPLEP